MFASDHNFLMPKVILPRLRVSSVRQLIKIFAEYIAREAEGICVTELEDMMAAQEQKSPSGIGEGVAIFQMTVPSIEEPFLILACPDHVVDISAVDNEPIDLIVCLVSPEQDAGPIHLRRLSRISRMMRDRDFCSCLRSADTEDAVRAIWSGAEQWRIAA